MSAGDELTPEELAVLDTLAAGYQREELGRSIAGVLFDEGRDKRRSELLENITRAQLGDLAREDDKE